MSFFTHKKLGRPKKQLISINLLGFVFFLSGLSSLIYQVVWQRLLTLYYGVGLISITLIVSIYMLGLGIGALWGGAFVESVKNKFRIYFIIELLIAGFGLFSLKFISWLGQKTAGSPYVLTAAVLFLFLSIPTFLMGTTLPVLTKIFSNLRNQFVVNVGFLYFINTLGAALGCLVSSYGLISFFGFDTAVYCAAGINIFLAIVIFLVLSNQTDLETSAEEAISPPRQQLTLPVHRVYCFALLMGLTAIAYEIAWFRLIGILGKASAYSFSSTLFVYLLGTALGSLWIKSRVLKHQSVNKKDLLFILQFLVGLSSGILIMTYYYLTKHTAFSQLTNISFSLPLHPPLTPGILEKIFSFKNFSFIFFCLSDIFLWSLFFMFLPTFFMGACFPLISVLGLKENDGKEGQAIGKIYFFNVMGSVLGAFLTGFWLLPRWGSERTLLLLSLIGLAWGLGITAFKKIKLLPLVRGTAVVILVMLFTLLFPKQGQLYQLMHTAPDPAFTSFFEEGLDGVVMTHQKDEHIITLINGMEHGGRPQGFFYFIPIEAMRFLPKIEDVLVIGYGTGSLSEAVLKSEEVQRLTIVEISGTLIKNLRKIALFKTLLGDPRIDLVIEDARRFLLQNNQQYDLILMDPLKTTTSYSNNIYSQEFFALAKKRLHPNGIMVVWMDEFPVMLKTISSIFEYVLIYDQGKNGFCLASSQPLKPINPQRSQKVLERFSAEQRKMIRNTTISPAGNEQSIKKFGLNVPVNQDLKPINEYYLGRSFYD